MNIQEIIDQEIASLKAQQNVESEIKRNKKEILLPIIEQVVEFLETIQENPNFLFSSDPHPKEGTPLFPKESCLTLEYHRQSAIDALDDNKRSNIMLRSFGFGNNQSRWIRFMINDQFKPIIAFTSSPTKAPQKEEMFYTVEDAVRAMTKFFVSKSLPLRKD